MSCLQISDSSIYYCVKGKGIPILFVHPPLLTSEVFFHQQNDLSDSFSTITFDIRGHGDSGETKEIITFQQIVEDIIALLNELNIEKAYLCGFSTGGSVVVQALLAYPDRFLGGILVSSAPRYSDPRNMRLLHIASNLIAVGGLSAVALAVSTSNADGFPTFGKLFMNAIKGKGKNVKEYYQSTMYFDCTDQLSSISCPVLLVYGEKDPLFREYGKVLQDRLQNVALHLIKKAPHGIPTKAWEGLNEIVRNWVTSMKP